MLSYTDLINRLVQEYKALSDAERTMAHEYAETLRKEHTQEAALDLPSAEKPQDEQTR